MTTRSAYLLCAPVLLASLGHAQFNDKWASFQQAPAAIASARPISDDDHETDLDWGDLDLDGDVDLVVVRKQPFTTTGMRSNVLLVNEGGVLTDRSSTLAASADVPGDQGFLTPTNDRDVVLADVNGDGLPDVITACEQTFGQPKHVSHPRVYRNLGSAGIAWQGLHFEGSRIPRLLHSTSGISLDPRFTAVDAGDLDGDGSVDLYFGDHDTGTSLFGALQPAFEDTDDRVLRNDGTGYFTDASTSMMTPAMLTSNFCNSVEVADFNGDGALDVLKQVSYQSPPAVYVAYNDASSPGTFLQQDSFTPGSPYFVNSGDLNNDGRLDIVVTQNTDDGVVFNLGNGPAGTAQWSPLAPFQFLSGGEPVGVFGLTYSSNNLVADVDGDGWSEVLVADVDVEISMYEDGLRLHLYHNRGGAVGGTDITLIEERASASDADWLGAHGLRQRDLRWTHDVAVFDVDLDARPDLILSRREGTQVWLQTDPPICQTDLGFGQGDLLLEVCGGDLSSGNDADLLLFAGPPNTPTLLAVGAAPSPTFLPQYGVTVAAFPPIQILAFTTDSKGELSFAIPGGLGPATVVLQGAQPSAGPTPIVASNAVQVALLP